MLYLKYSKYKLLAYGKRTALKMCEKLSTSSFLQALEAMISCLW